MLLVVRRLSFLLAVMCVFAAGGASFVQQAGGQAKQGTAQEEPAAVLGRAKEVLGFGCSGRSIIHYHAVAASEHNYESDRTYPPFFSAMKVKEAWLDPQSGVERVSTETTFPGGGPPAQVSLTDAKRAFGLAKDQLNPLPRTSIQSRYLNPWAVIADWAAGGDVRFAGREQYRDHPRIVLARTTLDGEQRLFVDPEERFSGQA